MKNIFYSFFFFLFILSVANAQTQAGKKLLGGNAGFSFSKQRERVGNTSTDRFAYRSLYFNPNVGFFIFDNFAIGGKMNLGTYTTVVKDELLLFNGSREDGKRNSTQFTIGPWARYYFPLGTKSAVFGDASFGFGMEGYKRKVVRSGRIATENEPNRGLFQFGIGPGYSYFLTENIGLEGLLQFRYDRTKFNANNRDEISYANYGLFFNIGLQVYF